MAIPFAVVQNVLSYVAANLEGEVSLATLAARAGLSPYHLHRVFSRALRETPKQLAFRLRLCRAAVLLLTSRDSVLDVALSSGFQSHEVFCRAFRRHFHMTPRAYRERGFVQRLSASDARRHAAIVQQVAPCVSLYRLTQQSPSEENDMNYSVTKQNLAPQPVLVARCRVKRSDIAKTIGESLPKIFAYAQQHGIALAGLPFTRYTEMGPGLLTMEPGMCIAAGAQAPSAPGADGVFVDTLPGGPAATTMHIGPYDGLHEAYVAIEQWMKTQGLVSRGAPWESYVTDPGEYPDPRDWKTEVFWPVG